MYHCRKSRQNSSQRENIYNETLREDHMIGGDMDYSTGLIHKSQECQQQQRPPTGMTHIPVATTDPVEPHHHCGDVTMVTLKRPGNQGSIMTSQFGPDGFPPPPAYLLHGKTPGHQYESPTFS